MLFKVLLLHKLLMPLIATAINWIQSATPNTLLLVLTVIVMMVRYLTADSLMPLMHASLLVRWHFLGPSAGMLLALFKV